MGQQKTQLSILSDAPLVVKLVSAASEWYNLISPVFVLIWLALCRHSRAWSRPPWFLPASQERAMEQIEIRTQERQGFYDITSRLQDVVRQSGVQDGICYIFCPHTTAGLTLNENWDADVQHDMKIGLDAISPGRSEYRHGEGNSPAHIKSTLVGATQFVFVEEGELALGRWQGIYLAEFDGPRSRRVWVRVVGG
jgi:secondary thiamine-phosphate synthase enzyme